VYVIALSLHFSLLTYKLKLSLDTRVIASCNKEPSS